MTTYTAHAEPGQGITFPSCNIVKGFNGIVKRGDKTIHHGPLYTSKTSALTYAKNKAAEYKAFRAKHGEGIEDGWERKRLAREATRRMRVRLHQKDQAMLDLLRPIVSDMDLVRAELPVQAISRIEKARELIAFIDTDTQ